MSSTSLLEMKHVKKTFGSLEVLKDISIEVNEGEVVAIIGPSGSGKSTFADALTNCLTKEKKRVMIICSSVNNIFEKYREK